MKKLFFVFVIFLSILFAQAQPSKASVGQCCYPGSSCPGDEVCTAPSSSTPSTCLPAGYTCQIPEELQVPAEILGGGSCSDTEINSAIGCIPINNTDEFIGYILRWAVGVGGGIAFLLIILAGFQIMTSSGNPDRLKAGQELMTSAIAGLVLLIFSVFILKIIGVDILRLPGFGG